jgi:hypothetical protein
MFGAGGRMPNWASNAATVTQPLVGVTGFGIRPPLVVEGAFNVNNPLEHRDPPLV